MQIIVHLLNFNNTYYYIILCNVSLLLLSIPIYYLSSKSSKVHANNKNVYRSLVLTITFSLFYIKIINYTIR